MTGISATVKLPGGNVAATPYSSSGTSYSTFAVINEGNNKFSVTRITGTDEGVDTENDDNWNTAGPVVAPGVDAAAAAAKAAEGETMDETESPHDDIKAAEGIEGDDYEGYQLTGDDFMGLPGVNTTAGRVGNFVGCPDCG